VTVIWSRQSTERSIKPRHRPDNRYKLPDLPLEPAARMAAI
jgi:hypothetical protein